MRTQIALGVIYNKARDKVLLARRPDNTFQEGLWEFPGGKILPGENVKHALERELFEEVNLRTESAVPLITVDHDYPGLPVTLNVYSVYEWRGRAIGNEGQHIEWVPVNNLKGMSFPDANNAIINAVSLPHFYLITPDLPAYEHTFLDDLDGVLQAGVKLLQLRCKQIHGNELENTVNSFLNICNKNSCLLIINSESDKVSELTAHGVHLTSNTLVGLNSRPVLQDEWIGASCHDQRELDYACAIGVDFAVLSPIKNTSSHPGKKALGWTNFHQLVRSATVPVYALGGMKAGDMRIALENGGQGIAMISGIWEAKDKVGAVKRVLEEEV